MTVESTAAQAPSVTDVLRRVFRRSESWFVLLAALVGAGAGALTVAISEIAYLIQRMNFGLLDPERLSAQPSLNWIQLAVLPIGGAALALFTYLTRARRRPLVDAVEANALHGGRMSFRDSLIISGQTLLSNGFGASVGLEAAYAQMGGSTASVGGRIFALRRADFRTLVGAGAGAGIAAAFGAPLVGAFYAFEIVIGAYSPATIAPVAAASLAGALVANALGGQPFVIHSAQGAALSSADFLLYALLGVVAGLVGIAIMRAVSMMEGATVRSRLPRWARPFIGGLLLVPIAALSPQVLSAGHGALHLDLAANASIAFIAFVFLAKCLASIVSLGFGFRGGLFFASLFLGTLLGHFFAAVVAAVAGPDLLNGADAATVGMAALAVAIIGGPMTMAMLVLETTHDFALTGAVIAASIVAATVVRERFGYSFSTWRLHLRGETIKSARDVGWVKTLTAGRMMRGDVKTIAASTTVAGFRRRFPLGSAKLVVLLDEEDHYSGIVTTAAAYGESVDPESAILDLAGAKQAILRPENDISVVMRTFDDAATDELAVVAKNGDLLGLLSETFVRKRYAEELEKAQRDLFGERE